MEDERDRAKEEEEERERALNPPVTKEPANDNEDNGDDTIKKNAPIFQKGEMDDVKEDDMDVDVEMKDVKINIKSEPKGMYHKQQYL